MLPQVLAFCVAFYAYGSVVEWIAHRYVMHGLGLLGPIFKALGTTRSHIEHHSETTLKQEIPDDFRPGGLVFELPEQAVLFAACLPGSFGAWYATGLKALGVSWTTILLFTLVVSQLYFWVWSSVHAAYHQRYVKTNQTIPDIRVNSSKWIFSILPYFTPDNNSAVYKYLFWYHTLHHLNKGVSKGNFNILLPFADFILGTYTSRCDNSKHFANGRKPANAQEEWLAQNVSFDVAVYGGNRILYKSAKGWAELPDKF